MSKIKISPSMMCANFLELKPQLDLFEKHQIDYLHIDIMDGHYVPNIALSFDFCKLMATNTAITLDIHMMVENIDTYFEYFKVLNNPIITFHPETSKHPVRTIQNIRAIGAKPGIAIDPAISIDNLKHLIPLVDQICIMSVNPGYAGQELIPFCIDKIKELKVWLLEKGLKAEIEVDGNVSWENIPKMIGAGADVLVLGSSSIFCKDKPLEDNILKLQQLTALHASLAG